MPKRRISRFSFPFKSIQNNRKIKYIATFLSHSFILLIYYNRFVTGLQPVHEEKIDAASRLCYNVFNLREGIKVDHHMEDSDEYR